MTPTWSRSLSTSVLLSLSLIPARLCRSSEADPSYGCAQTKVERWHRGEPRLEEYVGSNKLQGKKAIITGGDSGIGRTVAAFFAREGADVTINYLESEEKECVDLALSSRRGGSSFGTACLRLHVHARARTDSLGPLTARR